MNIILAVGLTVTKRDTPERWEGSSHNKINYWRKMQFLDYKEFSRHT